MTVPYPVAPDSALSPAELRHHTATPTPYPDADSGDLVGSMIGAISSGAYTAQGTFKLVIEVPFDIIGNPTDLMRSQGEVVLVELYRVVPQ